MEKKILPSHESGMSWTLFWVYNNSDISHQFANWAWRAWQGLACAPQGSPCQTCWSGHTSLVLLEMCSCSFCHVDFNWVKPFRLEREQRDAAASCLGSSKINSLPASPACFSDPSREKRSCMLVSVCLCVSSHLFITNVCTALIAGRKWGRISIGDWKKITTSNNGRRQSAHNEKGAQ